MIRVRTLSGRAAGRALRRTAVAGLSTAVVLVGVAVTQGTTAHADTGAAPAPARTAARGTRPGCKPIGARTKTVAAMARLHRAGDQPHYTARQLRRLDRQLHRRLARSTVNRPQARFTLRLRIPVAVHVLAGTHDPGPSRAAVRRELRVVNNAYSGGQSARSAASRFTFDLDSYKRTVNQAWHVASLGDRATWAARQHLHVGGPDELNLYISAPSSGNRRDRGVVLGWSSMPWRAQRAPRQDGVTIHEGSLPGGRLWHYNRGDTAVHEIGHWLGLFHTFQGGCSRQGDRVADTPAEQYPSTRCDAGRNTCRAPGGDPVHNFMDYSYDTCMNRFTPDQVNRMTDNWLAYRTP